MIIEPYANDDIADNLTMEAMNTTPPRTYVLVHGAFVGAWSWSRVVPELEAAGHAVHAPARAGKTRTQRRRRFAHRRI